MDHEILQSTLDDLSDLFIRPKQLTLKDDVEPIGVGGYGEVFLAVLKSSVSQTKVAVKQWWIVQAKGIRCRIAIRLAKEFKVWATAKHPHILELLGFYLSNDCSCAHIVSEYMANGNVKEYISEHEPNLATRLKFVQGITSGMNYLHSCNPSICHGDLKPTNVLINENLDAVLGDFGLARFILESVSSGLIPSKSVNGAARYMAPELVLDHEAKLTLESDVWAWACTTFEVLTGREPFSGTKRKEAVVRAIVIGRGPGSVDLLDDLVSGSHIASYHLTLDSLKSIIPHCWIRDPAKRPSSSEILNRLIFPDGIEAVDIATTSSHLSATEDRQPEPFPPPNTDLPIHTDVKKKRKGSPGLEGRLEKRARGKDATIETEVVRKQKGYREGAILMNGHESAVYRCQWNPLKCDALATGSADSEVRLWKVPVPPAPPLDPVTIKHHPDSEDDCYIETMEWDSTGARLATGCDHGVLRVWTAEGALQSNLEFHTDPISSNKWSPSGLFLLSASSDGTAVVWDMRTRKRDKIYKVFSFHSEAVLDALWLDDETLISCGDDGDIHICRVHKETPLRTFTGHERGVLLSRLSKDKTLLASSSYDLTIRVWTMDAVEAGAPVHSLTGQTDPAQKWVLRGHTDAPTSLGWCPSMDPAMQYLLVSTSHDNTSRIWDARNGSCMKELLGHRGMVWTQAFSPRGRYLATGSGDGRVLIYSSATGTLLFDWDCQSRSVFNIQWQSGGDQLAACLKNGGVAILDTKRLGLGD